MERPYEQDQYRVYRFQSVPLVTTALYAAPKVIEVGNRLGLSAERLYFSPKQFPVTDLENAGDNETFKQLKDYIIEQSLLAGNSPVVYHGTDCRSKRFICKYALEKNWKEKFGNIPFTRCKFSLLVKWDKYGYYIHTSKPEPTYSGDNYLIERKCVVGCEFHNHPVWEDTCGDESRKSVTNRVLLSLCFEIYFTSIIYLRCVYMCPFYTMPIKLLDGVAIRNEVVSALLLWCIKNVLHTDLNMKALSNDNRLTRMERATK